MNPLPFLSVYRWDLFICRFGTSLSARPALEALTWPLDTTRSNKWPLQVSEHPQDVLERHFRFSGKLEVPCQHFWTRCFQSHLEVHLGIPLPQDSVSTGGPIVLCWFLLQSHAWPLIRKSHSLHWDFFSDKLVQNYSMNNKCCWPHHVLLWSLTFICGVC